MSTADLARRTWSEADKRLLIEYWSALGSILLIALLLDRPEGSVQTEASRLNLPRRTEEKGRHRKKWTEDEERDLQTAINIFRTTEGRIRIIEVANFIGRSIDAVASRILRDYESRDEMRGALFIPDDVDEIKRLTARSSGSPRPAQTTDTRKQQRMRDCLTCSKPFWSDGAHNRICPRCKSDQESSDWDF